MKADAFDLLVAFIDCNMEKGEIELPNGRALQISRHNGDVVVRAISNPKLQLEIDRAKLRQLYGD